MTHQIAWRSFLLAGVLALLSQGVCATGGNVAVVNGKVIPSSKSDSMLKMLQAQGQVDSPQLRQNIQNELINREVIAQEAERQGLGKSAQVKDEIDNARQAILIQALLSAYIKKNPVGDADIKAEYDRFKAQSGGKEYQVRHILLDNEEAAKDVIAKLKSGGKFEELAKQSKDTGSAAQGGKLGWVAPAMMVKPFSDAMVALKKGEISSVPVRSQFGFHVLQLEDSRTAKIPSFEELKPRIRDGLQQQKLQAYQAELRSKATVQ